MPFLCKHGGDQALALQHFQIARKFAGFQSSDEFLGCHREALRMAVWEKAAGNTLKALRRRRVVKG